MAKIAYTITFTQQEFDRTLAAVRAYELLLDGHEAANVAVLVEDIATNAGLHTPPTPNELDAIASLLIRWPDEEA